MILLNLGCYAYAQQPKFVIRGFAQGTSYQVTYFAEQELLSKGLVDSLLKTIDLSMSTYVADSRISQFNRPNMQSIALDSYMLDVLKTSFQLHKISNGLFDITVKPLVAAWGFGPDKSAKYPSAEEITALLKVVGMQHLQVKKKQLHKLKAGVSIDLNGIAQGYSVDVLCKLLDKKGIKNYIVELGGEIRTKGKKADGQYFQVAVERPSQMGQESLLLQLENCAITTSGSYQEVLSYKDKKIHHHIDPRSGYPLQSAVLSVTVIAPSGILADGYDNVFMALPIADGLALANSLKQVEIYLIYQDEGTIKEAFSKGFSKFIKGN